MLLTTPARSTAYPLSVTAPEPPMPLRQLLSEADLALRWGMSPKTLQRWRMQGRGPHDLKLGKRVNYPLNAVIAFENCVQHVDTGVGKDEAARFRIDDGDLQIDDSQPKEIIWDQQRWTAACIRCVCADWWSIFRTPRFIKRARS